MLKRRIWFIYQCDCGRWFVFRHFFNRHVRLHILEATAAVVAVDWVLNNTEAFTAEVAKVGEAYTNLVRSLK